MAVILTREQRDALRADLLLELSALACDISLMLKKDRPSDAEGFCRRLVDDARLLDDLGWEEADPRESYSLTMSPERLEPLLRRFEGSALEDLDHLRQELRWPRDPLQTAEDYAESKAAIRRDMDQNLDVRSACTAALEALGAEGGR